MANNVNMQQIMQMMGGNPQAFLNAQMQRNPQLAQMRLQLDNMQKSSGMSEKDFAMQYARQNGIDPNMLQQLANSLGVK